MQEYLTIKNMDWLAKFSRIINRVHRSAALTIPKGKHLIARIYDFFVADERSGAAVFFVFREELDKLKTKLFRIFSSQGVNARCTATDYCRDIQGEKLGKIKLFNTSASNYSCFHVAAKFGIL